MPRGKLSPEELQTVGDLSRRLRKELHLSQRRAAEIGGIDPFLVSRLERHQSVSPLNALNVLFSLARENPGVLPEINQVIAATSSLTREMTLWELIETAGDETIAAAPMIFAGKIAEIVGGMTDKAVYHRFENLGLTGRSGKQRLIIGKLLQG